MRSVQRFDEIPRDVTQKDMNLQAEANGFTYRPAIELVKKSDLAELIERLKEVVPSKTPITLEVQQDANA